MDGYLDNNKTCTGFVGTDKVNVRLVVRDIEALDCGSVRARIEGDRVSRGGGQARGQEDCEFGLHGEVYLSNECIPDENRQKATIYARVLRTPYSAESVQTTILVSINNHNDHLQLQIRD